MLDYLERLRERPEGERRRIALLSTTAIFGLVFLVWWWTFTSPVTEDSVSASEAVTPLGVVASVGYSARDQFYALPGKLMSLVRSASSSSEYERSEVPLYPEDLRSGTQATDTGAKGPAPLSPEPTPVAPPASVPAKLEMLPVPEIPHIELEGGATSGSGSATEASASEGSGVLVPTKPGRLAPQ